jgi:Carboxypeptidase regulatory-like domain
MITAPVAYARVYLGAMRGSTSAISADAHGGFAFRGISPGTYDVYATSDSRASQPSRIDGAKGAADLRLAIADAMIAGVVVDEQGGPLAEVAVDAMPQGSMIFANGSRDVTDSRGRFELGPLPVGSYELRAEWPGAGDENLYLRHDTVVAFPGRKDMSITLASSGTIEGRVTVGGAPLRHFAVAIDDRDSFARSAKIVNAADGRFTRAYVPAGTWRVAIVGDDVELHVIPIVHVERGRTVDLGTIDLPPARHVRGRVLDANDAPVAGASVYIGASISRAVFELDPDPVAMALRGQRKTIAGADGRFDIALVGTTGASPVRIMASDASGARSQERAVPAGSDEIVLRLAAAAAIAGVVHGARGMTTVMAHSPEGGGDAMVDDQGRFQIDGLAPGRYQVSAMRTQPMQSTPPTTVELAAGATATVDLSFPSGGVTLVVRGAHGDSDKCHLALLPATGDREHTRSIAHDRCAPEIRVPNLEPGAYRVCVNADCRPVTVTATPDQQMIDLAR